LASILINAALTGEVKSGQNHTSGLRNFPGRNRLLESEPEGEKTAYVKIGSRVRLIGIPDGLEDYPDLPTKPTFEKCMGREFVIAGFNEVGMAELGIQSVTGSEGEKIWVETQFLELVPK
jgi:hypothetical protein